MAKTLEAPAVAETVVTDPAWGSTADPGSFADLMRQHQAMVFSLAYHFLQNRTAAEDLTQDVFLALYQHLAAIQSPAHLQHWLRQVTSRRCIDIARRERFRRFLSLQDAPEPSAELRPADPALDRRLHALVGSLPAKLRMTIVLRYQEDLQPSEIAAVLGVSINTVKSSLRRSLDLLRRKLARQLPGVHT